MIRAFPASEVVAWRPTLPEFSAYQVNNEYLIALSIHEAAHACVAISLGVAVDYATVRPDGTTDGHVHHATIASIPDAIVITLAGPASVEMFDEKGEELMGGADRRQAKALLDALRGSDRESKQVDVAEYQRRAEEAVVQHWPWIEAVATELRLRQRLTGEQIAACRPPDERSA